LGKIDYLTVGEERVLASGKMVVGIIGIVNGILCLSPEPIFTKSVAAFLTGMVTYGSVVLAVVDGTFKSIQSKRKAHQNELLMRVSWQERQRICLEQLHNERHLFLTEEL